MKIVARIAEMNQLERVVTCDRYHGNTTYVFYDNCFLHFIDSVSKENSFVWKR